MADDIEDDPRWKQVQALVEDAAGTVVDKNVKPIELDEAEQAAAAEARNNLARLLLLRDDLTRKATAERDHVERVQARRLVLYLDRALADMWKRTKSNAELKKFEELLAANHRRLAVVFMSVRNLLATQIGNHDEGYGIDRDFRSPEVLSADEMQSRHGDYFRRVANLMNTDVEILVKTYVSNDVQAVLTKQGPYNAALVLCDAFGPSASTYQRAYKAYRSVVRPI